jgi:hypothetical protein
MLTHCSFLGFPFFCQTGVGGRSRDVDTLPNSLLGVVAMTPSPLLRAVGSGALSASIALIIWYGLVQITDEQLNFVAAGVGWAIGLAVEKSVGPHGSWQARAISGGLALATIITGSYLTLNHLWLVNVPTFQGWISPSQFLLLYQAQFNGGRGVIDLVSALVGLYEAVVTPPGQAANQN